MNQLEVNNMEVFVGDDWAEAHHDVHLMNDKGEKLAAKRLPEGLEGITKFHELVSQHAQDPSQVTIGIETERGLWVEALIAAGYNVYAINPLSANRYREGRHLSGAKSDPADAKLLADIVRKDRDNLRQIAGDSAEVGGLKVLARAQQNLIWERTRQTNRLRSDLREYFPAALVAFEKLGHSDAVAVLGTAPHPDAARKLSVKQIAAALRKGGRQRNVDLKASEIQTKLRTPQLAAPAPIAAAFAVTTQALVQMIATLNKSIDELNEELAKLFKQHPDADIYLSIPGIGDVLGARALSEFGDDPERYADAKSRRNYAGTSPITIASGIKRNVKARHIRNRRLSAAIDQIAFCATNASPGCQEFYNQRRARGDLHHQALRCLGNRLIGYLHGCLRTGQPYNEHTAWAHRQTVNQTIA